MTKTSSKANSFLSKTALKKGCYDWKWSSIPSSWRRYCTEHPTKNSKVTVHYHGTLIDGTVFDSSVERGEPISFALKQVIKGWQEGLDLHGWRSKSSRLFIPSQLAYGKGGLAQSHLSATLIFDVELISSNNEVIDFKPQHTRYVGALYLNILSHFSHDRIYPLKPITRRLV